MPITASQLSAAAARRELKPGTARLVLIDAAAIGEANRGSWLPYPFRERINTRGARWWRGVPGIGAGKAARIVDWLTLHEASIGMSIGRHALLPSSQLQPSELVAVVPQATVMVPLEKFLVPAELDGSAGAFRGERSTLAATNDYEVISAGVDSKQCGEGAQGAATKRA